MASGVSSAAPSDTVLAMPTVAPALREHWTLDPTICYLNHGSFGATPKAVLAVQAELRARMEREPVLFLHREIEGLLDEAKAALAAFVGARAEDLVPVNNATTGVSTVLRSLEFAPSDEILVTDHGYNACNNAADFVAERTGARVVRAAVPFPLRSPDQVVEPILAAVSPRTRLVLVDHVTSPTGLIFPIERLIAPLRERGLLVMIDGAHAPGMLPLDVDALGADFYTGNCHKWLCSPKGAAFLHVRAEHQARIRPLAISHGANSRRQDRSRYRLELDYDGTDDPTAFLSVPAALRFLGALFPGGWSELRRRNRELALAGRALLCDALGIAAPAPEEMIGSLASVPLPDARSKPIEPLGLDPLQLELFQRHHVEVPVMAWPAPPRRLLRISPQAYNTLGEIRALAEALPAALGLR
jgi:isopenicillin-N epimerase